MDLIESLHNPIRKAPQEKIDFGPASEYNTTERAILDGWVPNEITKLLKGLPNKEVRKIKGYAAYKDLLEQTMPENLKTDPVDQAKIERVNMVLDSFMAQVILETPRSQEEITGWEILRQRLSEMLNALAKDVYGETIGERKAAEWKAAMQTFYMMTEMKQPEEDKE